MEFRLFLLGSLQIIFLSLSAQKDLKYFLDGNKKFVDSTLATYYVIYKTNPDTLINSGTVDTYFIKGLLLKHVDYKYKADGTKQENEIYYYQNGNIGNRINTIDLPYEERLSYFENGELKRKAYYNAGTVVTEQCFTNKGKDTVCYETDDRKPEYPGGMPALDKFIKKNLKYPEEAKRKGISGVVQISVIIDRQGGIENLSIQKSVDPLLDAEAIRVIRSMERWTPGLYRDQLLPKYQSIQVVFELPKK